MTSARIAVLGADDLRAAVVALGFEVVEVDRAQVAIVDARDRAKIALASALPAGMPRLTIAAPDDAQFFTAVGMDRARIVTSAEPARIGPALVALLPRGARAATRILLVTGTRGGVGRTLLAANLALRLAKGMRVSAIDGTGTGALAWWLRAAPKPWSDVEAIADELTAEHLSVIADPQRGVRVIGGPCVAPSVAALDATVRVAAAADDLVIIDAPIASDTLTRALSARSDRRIVLAYDEPCSVLLLDAEPLRDGDWLIASQSKKATIAAHAAFRALPRDEGAIGSAASSHGEVGGALGRAYSELAELIAIDATET